MFAFRPAKFKIKGFRKEIEPHEVFLDSLAQRREKELEISEKKLEFPLSEKIFKVFLIVFVVLILTLFGKTFQLQILEGKEYQALSRENEFIVRLIQSERGTIYDKGLNQLVFNGASFDLVCDGEAVAKDLDHQSLILIEARSDEYPGCEIKNNTARQYVSGPTFAPLIGYKRKTDEKTGLESYYDEVLKARPGELQIKRDVYGNQISKEIVRFPESGKSLVLWLDSELQKKVAGSLERVIRNAGAKAGAAVALDPKTGGVLAMFSFPTFDNNLFSQEMSQEEWSELQKHPQDPLFNRAISGEYPTGSTIKPLIASGVLQEEIISPTKEINCAGRIIIPNPWIPNASSTKEDWTIHGWTDMRKAIAESCNVYFYTVGGGYGDQEGLGPSRIKKYLELFGWGKVTGIDLAGETKGLIPDPAWKMAEKEDAWRDGDTYNLSIGQGDILVTPIQVAAAFSAIANGGTLYQPQAVQRILDGEEFAPKIVRENFINPENLRIVKEGMREAVIYGSSVSLSSLPVAAAAKTGTAQTPIKEVYHNWVTVFAPYDDPRIVLTVLIENVPGMQVAALSVANEVLAWYFSSIDIR